MAISYLVSMHLNNIKESAGIMQLCVLLCADIALFAKAADITKFIGYFSGILFTIET